MPDPEVPRLGEVAVVGGGIGGLAAAYFLGKTGARVTLYEASDQLGGLGTFFPYRDVHLERFYHCMLPSDRHLLGLLDELGLGEATYWKPTGFGFMRDGQLYPLNTPLDLLRFKPLPVVDRLRVGLTGAWGSVCSADGLDDVTCVEWLTRLSGRRAFDTFWKPMLQAKFGDRYHEVPALWFWTRFNREKGGKQERKGYISGGYRRIALALAAAIRDAGGELRLQAPVDCLDLDAVGRPLVGVAGESPRSFDQVLVTAPLAVLRKATASGKLAAAAGQVDSAIDMQGVVNGVFMLRRGLTPYYWVAAIDRGLPFQGIVESTTLLEQRDTGGVHLVYVMNYLHRSEPRFAAPETEILADYTAGLKHVFPALSDSDIVDSYLFRAPFVEPLYTRGYLGRRPPAVLLPGRVYLATSTQVYPQVTSWNGAVGVARQVVDQVLSEARAA